MRFVFLCALAAFAAPLYAQYPAVPDSSDAGSVAPILEPEQDEEANQATAPNRVPYETETNVGHHILAFPSTLWNGLASVFREGVLWAEYSGTIERLQRRYTGPEPPPYGFTPEINFGGREGLIAGGSVFYNDLFGTGRRVRIGGRYGLAGTYSVFGRFRDPGLFGTGLRLGLDGGYLNDEEERFFGFGNDSDEDERFEYALRRVQADARLLIPLPEHLSVEFEGEYKRMDVGNVDEIEGDDLPFPIDEVPGFGVANMLAGGASLMLDLSRSDGLYAEREYAGTIFLVSYRYGGDLGDRPFAYHRVAGEVRQFVSVPFLPFDRRFALRLRYEKTHPPRNRFVPFYEASTLGGVYTLRGYANDRFRDEGYLLFNAEYRWPVWDLFDGVVFYDAGQVFQRYKEVDFADFNHSVGAGLRVYGRSGVAGRLEAAYSPEGFRLIAQIGTVF